MTFMASFARSTTRRMGISMAPRDARLAAGAVASSLASTGLLSRCYATVMEGLKYAESHEWIKVDGDTATVGISDFAQEELGDVVYVELPEEGTELAKGDSFATIESVKAASDVYMPLSGTVTEVNSELTDEPSKVNEDAYGSGWLIKMKVASAGEVDEMMDSAAYSKSVEE
uniref:Glycine cleavage system H protein n=1 Tax=Prasinoderma singulare TaxID=676789 RepID=A0A7S3F4F3_9VIRI